MTNSYRNMFDYPSVNISTSLNNTLPATALQFQPYFNYGVSSPPSRIRGILHLGPFYLLFMLEPAQPLCIYSVVYIFSWAVHSKYSSSY